MLSGHKKGSDWAWIHLGIGYVSFKGPGPKRGGGYHDALNGTGEGKDFPV